MPKKVFFSFHYKPDNWRASQVRNIGIVEGNAPVTDNDWEDVTNGGEGAIKKWIDEQLLDRSCTIVLIGANTAGRKWIDYEIQSSWNSGKGLAGIYIHNLRDRDGYRSNKGNNPFESFTMDRDNRRLSDIVKVYDPPYIDSKEVYANISANLESWVNEAIKIRESY